jgi:hypothetical protein
MERLILVFGGFIIVFLTLASAFMTMLGDAIGAF